MRNLWFISTDTAEREGMKLFLSQKGFDVAVFDGMPSASELNALSPASVVICSVFDSKLPSEDDLAILRKGSGAKHFYFLGNSFNRTEIGFLLQHEVNGFFLRPLDPLAIIRKVQKDLEESEKCSPSPEIGSPPLDSISVSGLGTDQFSSEGWQILANQILGITEIPPLLYALCASPLIFRLFVQKLKRRLSSTLVFFLDGDETEVEKAILEGLEHGQWRTPPIVAIYSPDALSCGLAQFLIHDLGLLSTERNSLIHIILGSAVSPDQLLQSGRLDPSTAKRLQAAALELPSPEKFESDLPRILRWRVRQLANQPGQDTPLPPFPDDLFSDPLPAHTEVDALAHWIRRRTAATGEIDEATLRMVARHADLLPDLLEISRTAKARSATYLREREAALQFFSRPHPSSR